MLQLYIFQKALNWKTMTKYQSKVKRTNSRILERSIAYRHRQVNI